MSKQSSLFNFVSRDNTAKMKVSDDTPPATRPNKFKFNPKPSRLQKQTNTDENRSTNTIEAKTNGTKPTSSANDCVVISDDSASPVKTDTTKGMGDDDIFADYEENEWTFNRASTLVSNEAKTMEDLYAKYSSPKPGNKADSFDIDKELNSLNSHASIVNAKRKLDENMELLKKSPKKPVASSKFKFNTRSKPAVPTDQNATICGNSLNSTNVSSTITSALSFVSNAVNSSSNISPVNSSRNDTKSLSAGSMSSMANSGTNLNTYSPDSSSLMSHKQTTVVSPPDNSFKTIDDSP